MQFENPTPVALSDDDRASVLASFEISDWADDPRLKAITDFAATLCDTPVALVSFVETRRQWFAARTGLDATETPRELSFCAHAMMGTDIMVVPDATHDARFRNNALVIGEPNIRFYAGAPLVTEAGIPLGALCVIDSKPRADLSDMQRQGLSVLAANVVSLLSMRRDNVQATRVLDETEARFRVLADAMPQMVWSTRPDGYHDYYNARWYEFTGMPAGTTDGEGWNDMFHPDDQERAWTLWRHSLQTGDPYEIEYRLRHKSGQYRWTLGRALPIRLEDGKIARWFGTCTDIHDSKMLQHQAEIVSQELSHRIKNIFSIISGLISLTVRSHPGMAEGGEALRSRVLALGRAHNLISSGTHLKSAVAGYTSLRSLLDELLAPYLETAGGRIQIDGEDLRVDDRSATPLALLFHELATNAAKYGALSQEEGSLAIGFQQQGENFAITWRESGVQGVQPPRAEGFGSKLVDLSIVRQLDGVIERAWPSDGLDMRVSIPVTSLIR